MLTNDVVSFEQQGPGVYFYTSISIKKRSVYTTQLKTEYFCWTFLLHFGLKNYGNPTAKYMYTLKIKTSKMPKFSMILLLVLINNKKKRSVHKLGYLNQVRRVGICKIKLRPSAFATILTQLFPSFVQLCYLTNNRILTENEN